jgi:hypothetical protein
MRHGYSEDLALAALEIERDAVAIVVKRHMTWHLRPGKKPFAKITHWPQPAEVKIVSEAMLYALKWFRENRTPPPGVRIR